MTCELESRFTKIDVASVLQAISAMEMLPIQILNLASLEHIMIIREEKIRTHVISARKACTVHFLQQPFLMPKAVLMAITAIVLAMLLALILRCLSVSNVNQEAIASLVLLKNAAQEHLQQ